jgi:ribosomal-protein-alanine N-acetyltransferase
MTVADHTVVGEVGFAAWTSSDAFKDVDLAQGEIDRARSAFETFAPATEAKVYIAERDGKVLGWGAQERAPNDISDLWIHPDQQGKGVGKALLLHIVETIQASGHATATIQTQASNVGAIRLYERCGFEIVWRGIEHSKSLGMDLEKVHLEKSLR